MRAKWATFAFWVDKSSLKMPKIVNFGEFWKTETCGQKVFPDKSISIRQKLVEKPKLKNQTAIFCVIFRQCELATSKWQL